MDFAYGRLVIGFATMIVWPLNSVSNYWHVHNSFFFFVTLANCVADPVGTKAQVLLLWISNPESHRGVLGWSRQVGGVAV